MARRSRGRAYAPILRAVQRRPWLSRVLAMSFSFALLAVAEMGLRVVGAGYPTSFFIEKTSGDRRVLVSNREFGRLFFPPEIARTPLPMLVPLRKSSRATRLVLLGESAARGDPDPALGFSRLLSEMLQAQNPARGVELLDTGVVAINSRAIVEIAKSFPVVRPDVVILYMGHNEVVGPYGAGTVFSPLFKRTWEIRLHLALKKLRLSQLMEELIRFLTPGPPAQWGGMAMFVNNQVPADSPALAVVYGHFEENLNEIIARARREGARVLLCTLGANLRDAAPFGSAHRPDLTPEDLGRWKQRYELGRRWMERRRWAQALAAFDSAALLDARFADLQFQRARCLLFLRRIPAAQEAFRAARDLDTLRFRADSQINETIRRTARRWAGDGVQLVDIEKELDKASPDGIAGMNYFLEHVHPNFDGNYVVARALGKALGADPMDRDACAARVGYNAWVQRQVLERMLPRLAEPPFSLQSNHAAQTGYLEALIRSIPDDPASSAKRPIHLRPLGTGGVLE